MNVTCNCFATPTIIIPQLRLGGGSVNFMETCYDIWRKKNCVIIVVKGKISIEIHVYWCPELLILNMTCIMGNFTSNGNNCSSYNRCVHVELSFISKNSHIACWVICKAECCIYSCGTSCRSNMLVTFGVATKQILKWM